jgi:hypothetical protein
MIKYIYYEIIKISNKVWTFIHLEMEFIKYLIKVKILPEKYLIFKTTICQVRIL